MAMKDITGQRFGRLTALRPTTRNSSGSMMWECQCDCGNIVLVNGSSLRADASRSCGCLKNEKSRERMQDYKEKYYIDGTMTNRLSQKTCKTNTSGVVGVSYAPKRNRWKAYIDFRGKQYALGTYTDKNEAIEARKKAEAALHDKFLELYQQGEIPPDSPGFTDELIKFDFEQVLSRHKYEDHSSRQQGIPRRRKPKISDYVGVTFKHGKFWNATISHRNAKINLGNFETEVLAAQAYDEKAKELYGEHARLNFPEKKIDIAGSDIT